MLVCFEQTKKIGYGKWKFSIFFYLTHLYYFKRHYLWFFFLLKYFFTLFPFLSVTLCLTKSFHVNTRLCSVFPSQYICKIRNDKNHFNWHRKSAKIHLNTFAKHNERQQERFFLMECKVFRKITSRTTACAVPFSQFPRRHFRGVFSNVTRARVNIITHSQFWKFSSSYCCVSKKKEKRVTLSCAGRAQIIEFGLPLKWNQNVILNGYPAKWVFFGGIFPCTPDPILMLF